MTTLLAVSILPLATEAAIPAGMMCPTAGSVWSDSDQKCARDDGVLENPVPVSSGQTVGGVPGTSGAEAGQTVGGVPGTSRPSGSRGVLFNPIGSTTLDQFVAKVTAAALKIGVPIASLFIIWAGFKFVTARGDETAIKDAKKMFWYTIIGTAILLAASLLARVLSETIRQVSG